MLTENLGPVTNFAPSPAGGVPRASNPGREAARAYFSELASKFPGAMTAYAGFEVLPITAGLTIGAGKVGWFSLLNFDPWERLGQDIVVFGMWYDALSCNPTPTTPASQAAWGDEQGLGAAVMVGGGQVPVGPAGTWQEGPCPIIGVDENVTGLVTNSVGQKFWSRTFPTGKFTTGFNKRGLNGAIVPFVYRVTRGDQLRAGLALNRTDANAGQSKSMIGYMELEVYFGLTRNPRDLEQ